MARKQFSNRLSSWAAAVMVALLVTPFTTKDLYAKYPALAPAVLLLVAILALAAIASSRWFRLRVRNHREHYPMLSMVTFIVIGAAAGAALGAVGWFAIKRSFAYLTPHIQPFSHDGRPFYEDIGCFVHPDLAQCLASGKNRRPIDIASSKSTASFLHLRLKNLSDDAVDGVVKAVVAYRRADSDVWSDKRAIMARWGSTGEFRPLHDVAQFDAHSTHELDIAMQYPDEVVAYTFTNASYNANSEGGRVPTLGVFSPGAYLAHVQLYGSGWKCAWDMQFEVESGKPLRVVSQPIHADYFIKDDGSVTTSPFNVCVP